jgi:UDP-glucose 4-epimerase
VTGASGFIGTALCHFLAQAGADVWGLRLRSGAERVPWRWLAGDVTDAAQVSRAVHASRPDAVFHLASVVTGSRKLELVVPMLQGNLLGFVNVAIAAAESQCKRIVTIGSLQEPDQAPLSAPSSPYAAAKFAASGYARMLAAVFAIPVVIARVFMVYGPGQRDFTKLVPYVLSQLLAGRKAALSSGTQAFDWIYVDDVCEALLAVGSIEGLDGRTIDIGTGSLTSVIEVARGLARRLDAPDLLQIGALPDRVGDPIRVADVTTTHSLIGWKARVDLETGLDVTTEWFKSQAASGLFG